MEKAGIYVHIPFCRSKCAYCSFCSTDDNSLQNKYFYRLKMEIEHTAQVMPVDTLYFGGGTPSMAQRGSITEIYNAIRSKFHDLELSEFTVECNPESVSYGFLSEVKRLGVNRLSMGLQSASDEILRAVGRVHTVSQYTEAVRRARSFGITDLSGDLILGLPEQKNDDIEKAIGLFSENGVEHISVYALSVEDGTPLAKSGYSIDPDEQADMYDFAVETLADLGYERYEVSNFCRNGKRAKHNVKYWTGADYYGFGAAAHSLIGKVRYENIADIRAYSDGKNTVTKNELSDNDIREELIMLRLRMTDGLSLSEYESKCGQDLLRTRQKEIHRLTEQGFLSLRGDRLSVTNKGFYLLNSIITELI